MYILLNTTIALLKETFLLAIERVELLQQSEIIKEDYVR